MYLVQVVLASMASLEAGFSHDIFVEWGSDVKNLVLFTEKGQVFFFVKYPFSLVTCFRIDVNPYKL